MNINYKDQETLTRLRRPIDDLISQTCSNRDEYEKVRLRQLAWQAVDVLIRTDNVAQIREDKNMRRIIGDIQKIGAPQKFIDASLMLAVEIYRRLQIDYPGLLKRYRGRG